MARVDRLDVAGIAALAALAVAAPSTLWRVLMIAGALPGTEALRADVTGGVVYVVALSGIELAAAVAVVGLAFGWFDGVVRSLHLPRRLPPAAGVVGGLAITWLFTISLPIDLVAGRRPDGGLASDGAFVVMLIVYAPIVAWGPLTVAASACAWPHSSGSRSGRRSRVRSSDCSRRHADTLP